MHESFLLLLASELDTSPREVSQALEEMRRNVIEEATTQQESRIDGLGVFRVVEGNLVFEPDDSLTDAINHRYSHLNSLIVERDIPDYLRSAEVKDVEPMEEDVLSTDQSETWTESLKRGENDPLGVGSSYEDAEFAVVEEDAKNSPDSASVDTSDADTGGSVLESVSNPRDETATEGVKHGEADSDEDIAQQNLGKPPSEKTSTPKHAATSDTLSDKERRRKREVEKSSGHIVLPASPFPYFGVLTHEELVDSSFVGAKLEELKGEPDSKIQRVSKKQVAGSRQSVSSRKQYSSERSWKNVLVIAGITAFLLVGGWLLAEQAGLTDQLTESSDETEEFLGGTDDDTDGQATDEETTPPLEEEQPEPEQSESPIDAGPDEPEEPAGPPPIEASAGMWTIVMASEATEIEAEQQRDELWQRFEDTDFPVDVIASNLNGATRYRVALGTFGSQDEATEYLNSLSDQLPEGSWLLQFDEDI